MIIAVCVLLLAGAFIVAVGWWLRWRSGVPFGDVAYSDTDAPAQPLISRRFGLAGKPDYIVRRNGVSIPVEVKPGRTADAPYDSDVMQLVAYMLMIEEAEKAPPPYGILHYRSASFRIVYSPALRQRLLDILQDMRSAADEADVGRSHESVGRCAACGFRGSCGESLAS